MLTLVCAIVGENGSAFAVEIEENKLVDALKEAIKRENDNYLKRVQVYRIGCGVRVCRGTIVDTSFFSNDCQSASNVPQ